MDTNLFSEQLKDIDGLIVLALVDTFDSAILQTIGDPFFNIDIAVVESANVLKYQRKLIDGLSPHDFLESLLISTQSHYHIIMPLETNDSLVLYTVLDRHHTNLGYARHKIQQFEQNLNFYCY